MTTKRGHLYAIAITAMRLNPKFENARGPAGEFVYRPIDGSEFRDQDSPIEFAGAVLAIIASNQEAARKDALAQAESLWPSADGWVSHRAILHQICAVAAQSFRKAFG